MPYTRREVKFLLSNGSPLTAAQKSKIKSELHSNPSLGHYRKGQIHKQGIKLKTLAGR